MSDELKHSQPAVDPEKGLLDSLPVHNGDVKAPLPNLDISPPLPVSKEKDTAVATTKEVVVATTPSKPPPKPKKKVPLWIVWTLWFNTYRYIALPLQQRQMLSPTLHQEIFYLLFRLQHDCPHLSRGRTFSLRC
jgi:hypothetical protein